MHMAFVLAPFEWSIGHFLIPSFNAQAYLVLHIELFYLLILNRVGHFNYLGFNAQGFLVYNSWRFAQVKLSWRFAQVVLSYRFAHIMLSWRFVQVIAL